jgi:hypothetical protein
MLPFVLGLLGFGLFVTSAAMAASAQPQATAHSWDRPLVQDPPTSTVTISPTHPVASAIADHFTVPYTEVEGFHDQGLGYGVIVKAYFISQVISGTGTFTDVTPADVLSEFLGGKGWGVIMKEVYGLHPGVAGRGGNLGGIMSNRLEKKGSVLPPGLYKKDAACWPPGHCKNNESGDDGSGFGPSGLKTSDEDDDNDRGGGPPVTPPGQLKKENKGKGKKK